MTMSPLRGRVSKSVISDPGGYGAARIRIQPQKVLLYPILLLVTLLMLDQLNIYAINCNSLNQSVTSKKNQTLKIHGITSLKGDIILLSDLRLSNKNIANLPGVKELIEGGARPEDKRSPEQPREGLTAAGSAVTQPQQREPQPVPPPEGGNSKNSGGTPPDGNSTTAGATTGTGSTPRADPGREPHRLQPPVKERPSMSGPVSSSKQLPRRKKWRY
jgi:hypothetical protein